MPLGVAAELAAAVSQHAQELDIVLLEERQHTVILSIVQNAPEHALR
jgi:hypothetical protein